ncbi:MAG: transposase, partial [Candidatus Geothermincolales bacterium]
MAQGKSYPPVFLAEAVRLYRISGRSLADTAREIDVSDWTLASWVHQADTWEVKAEGLTTEEREEQPPVPGE